MANRANVTAGDIDARFLRTRKGYLWQLTLAMWSPPAPAGVKAIIRRSRHDLIDWADQRGNGLTCPNMQLPSAAEPRY